MARTIGWTESATSDLEEAADFITRDSRFYAAALVRETQEAAQSLKSLAERGRRVPEISAPDIRELFIRNYRLIYQTMKSLIRAQCGVPHADPMRKEIGKKLTETAISP
ncbi:MAG: type II toxin-antitoxin system RelE/ParE family toxin [Nitrospirales bacterium]